MFQLYSALANPLVDSSFLRSEKRRDRKSFECEYGANFLDTLSAWIDDSSLFEKCINHEITKNLTKGKQGIEYFWGIDIGLKNDGTAITICHRDKANEKVIIDYSNVWFSASSDVWDSTNKIYREQSDKRLAGYDIIPMEQIVEIIKELAENFPPSDGWFDQFNGQALHEMLQNEGFRQFRMVSVSSGINMQTFQTTKNLYTSGLIEIPNIELLITELYTLEETRSSGGFVVEAPQRQGFHDDISVSFVRAVYACYNAKLKNKQEAVVLTNNYGNNYYQYQYRKSKSHGIISERSVGRRRLY
jgi:phage terminase large subunit-like protein